MSVHLKGKTECFECSEKPTPKSYPVCTVRSTPDKPIHLVVWGKYLYPLRHISSANVAICVIYWAENRIRSQVQCRWPELFERGRYEGLFGPEDDSNPLLDLLEEGDASDDTSVRLHAGTHLCVAAVP